MHKNFCHYRKSKALVGMFFSSGEARYFIYDINNNYNNLNTYYFIDQHCRNQFHGLKVN